MFKAFSAASNNFSSIFNSWPAYTSTLSSVLLSYSIQLTTTMFTTWDRKCIQSDQKRRRHFDVIRNKNEYLIWLFYFVTPCICFEVRSSSLLQQSQSHTELLYCLHKIRCVHVMFRSFYYEKFEFSISLLGIILAIIRRSLK